MASSASGPSSRICSTSRWSAPGRSRSSNGNIVPTGVQVGGGVKAGSVYRITEQGTPTLTDNPLDVAIQGKGYLQVLLPSGETAYTRAGNFSTNDQGQIVTEDGYTVQPGITVPQNTTDITISKTGLVQVKLDGQPQPQTIGQLQLATFMNEGGLEQIGDNLLLETAASGAATLAAPGEPGFGVLMQHYTEASNVDAVTEITSLITAQARLRDELEGDHHGRPDAPSHLAAAVVSA